MAVARATSDLAAIGRRFYDRGWMLGTSGNLSVVVSRQPLRLAMTASGAAKGALTAKDIVHVNEHGRKVGPRGGQPSAEALLHTEIVRVRGASAVLHTHSVWSTMLSDCHAPGRGLTIDRGLTIEGYEMLKGLSGIRTHETREWIPILENDQDMPRLAGEVRRVLEESPAAHALLLRRHGLYTWGASLAEAERHVEILEFLFEVMGVSHGHRTNP